MVLAGHSINGLNLYLKSPSGSSRRIENLLDLDQMSGEKSYTRTCQIPNGFYQERESTINEPSFIRKSSTTVASSSEHLKRIESSVDNCITNTIPTESNLPSIGRAADKVACPLISRDTSDPTKQSAESYGLAMDVPKAPPTLANALNPIDFPGFLREGYHKTLEVGGCHELAEVVTDDVNSSGSHFGRENHEEDDEVNDEMLGGIFAFSEEGKQSVLDVGVIVLNSLAYS